jgi:hypothetical protein
MQSLVEVQSVIAWGLTTLVGAFGGSYLGSYMSKKGENLATHEDVGKLVDQVRAVTAATKEIEARISNDVWDRQKRWELKRDVLFEIIKKSGTVSDTLTRLEAFYQTQRSQKIDVVGPERMKTLIDASKAFNDSANAFENAGLLAGLVCGKELVDAANQFILLVRNIAVALGNANADALQQNKGEFVQRMHAITVTVRKELEVDKQN